MWGPLLFGLSPCMAPSAVSFLCWIKAVILYLFVYIEENPKLNPIYSSISSAVWTSLSADNGKSSDPSDQYYTLQRKSHFCIFFLGIAQPQSQFPHSCVCERIIYCIPRIGPHTSCSRMGRRITEMYKSLSYTCMWKLGLMPHNSFSGNICF